MPKTTFIDPHCHLFNLVDVPVYESAKGLLNMNTMMKLVAFLGAGPVIASGYPLDMLEEYREFVKFFERPQQENVRAFAAEVHNAGGAGLTVLTPLVMDFDCVRHPCGVTNKNCTNKQCPIGRQPRNVSVANDVTVQGQYFRLWEAIQEIDASGIWGGNVKVFPFIGFDLRKLTPKNSTALTTLKAFWERVGVTKAERAKGFAHIENGKSLGIKLYPPIGFNPYPQKEKKALAKYKEFYEWCIEERIPITVHCQSGSYRAARKQREVDRDTHASNWSALFRDWGKGILKSDYSIDELRINFAHFGGEDGVEELFRYSASNSFRLDDAWTYDIVELLQKYPNTYSDLGAYDWVDSTHVRNFAKVLRADAANAFTLGDHSVSDKLLWGSDVPMIINAPYYRKGKSARGATGYVYLMQHFEEAVGKAYSSEAKKKAQIKKMVSITPEKFLLA